MSSHSPSLDGVVLVTNMKNYLQLHQLTAPNPGLFSYLQFVKSGILVPQPNTSFKMINSQCEPLPYLKPAILSSDVNQAEVLDAQRALLPHVQPSLSYYPSCTLQNGSEYRASQPRESDLLWALSECLSYCV